MDRKFLLQRFADGALIGLIDIMKKQNLCEVLTLWKEKNQYYLSENIRSWAHFLPKIIHSGFRKAAFQSE